MCISSDRAAFLILLGALAAAAPLSAQLVAFNAQVENDAFRDPGSDSSYTQGLRVNLFYESPLLAALDISRCSEQTGREEKCGLATFGIGQTIYTPGDIETTELQPRSRPYAGWLFVAPGVSARGRRTIRGWPVDLAASVEVLTGVVGENAFARHTQTWAHWTFAWGAARPAGWHHQLRNAFIVNPHGTLQLRPFQICLGDLNCTHANTIRIFDLATRGSVSHGNAMRFRTAGLESRLGWNLPEDLGPQVIPVTVALADGRRSPGRAFSAGFVFSWERRFSDYNRFVEGGRVDHGGGWADVRQIELTREMDQTTFGGFLRIESYSLAVRWVEREFEFVGPGQATDESGFNFLHVTVGRVLRL